MTKVEAAVRLIAVCYPTESLSRQLALWASRRGGYRVEPVFDRSATEVRRWLSDAELVLVDATDDHAQAIESFSQSVAGLGARRVAVYTERMHEGLELLVRKQGTWSLLGPLEQWQWEDFFSSMLPAAEQAPTQHECRWRGAA